MVVAAFRKSLLSVFCCGRFLKRNGGKLNKEVTANKMGTEAVPKVMLSMGIPIILSMVLQACYNIVDSMFVARIPDSGNITKMGEYAVNALTLAFPVQMLIVAFGIGSQCTACKKSGTAGRGKSCKDCRKRSDISAYHLYRIFTVRSVWREGLYRKLDER